MRFAALRWTKLVAATALFALMISAYPASDARADCHRLLCRMYVSCVDCDYNCAGPAQCEWGECVGIGEQERCKCFICAEP